MRTGEQNGVLDAVGNTPLLSLNRISERVGARVYAKVERFNPGGSIKDRAAVSMLLPKVEAGEIDPARTTIVESSSGNLAIGLAQLCRYFDMPFICVVDPKTPAHTRRILHTFGARIDVVQNADPHSGEYLAARLERVQELLTEVPGAYWPDQYANPLNPRAHETTMGEIVKDLDGHVDYLFAAVSTTGTLGGCSEYVRANGLATRVVAVDALGSVLFSDAPPAYRLIPGYGASIRPALLDADRADEVVHVSDLECVVGCRQLVRHEAMLMGGSAGATVAALHKVSGSIPGDATCVLIFPDGGDRYLETIYSDAWVRSQFGADPRLWGEGA